MRKLNSPLPALLLPLLLTGCASPSTPSATAVVTRQVQLPPLPASARQPQTPSACLPTCLQALTQERERWLTSLTAPTPPASAASKPTEPPAKP